MENDQPGSAEDLPETPEEEVTVITCSGGITLRPIGVSDGQ